MQLLQFTSEGHDDLKAGTKEQTKPDTTIFLQDADCKH